MTFLLIITVLDGSSRTSANADVASSGSKACYPGAFANGVDCGGSLSQVYVVTNPSQGAPSPAPTVSASAPPPNPLPILQAAPGGGQCLTQTTNPNTTTPAEVAYLNQLIKNLLVTFAPCPPTPGGTAAPALDPATLAEQFWQTIPLPVPQPSIPPGYAITGKPAYLVTDGTVAPPAFVEPTPLGLLTVAAHGTYTVDWGDGSTGGPYATEGTGYPNGQIVHTYDRVGTVDVAVHEAWTATWTLGAAAGTLGQLATVGGIPAFTVRQIQAIIEN
jgi:hypothetical protein